PWYAAYPAPSNQCPASITREQVLDMLKEKNGTAKRDFMLVDLRRADHVGGTIHSSINLPAQSLYPSLPALYTLFKAASISKVIWYCSSSRGRGTRATGWFEDYLKSEGDTSMTSLVLAEGIKGWVDAGPEYVVLMDEYDPKAW
ncbi:hypothetical protein CC80DRAFT_396618, partial [Byssothecium circinans]